jgi:thiamine biosynthesis lipoprotein
MSTDKEGNGASGGCVHAFNHHAMSTWWQVRISGENAAYAGQAAQAAFVVTDRMESLMSRFRDESEISAIAKLPSGGGQRISKEVFDCLSLAREVESLTDGAFDVCASEGSPRVIGQGDAPGWHLDAALLEIMVYSAPCRLDLGAIAKGFTLDRMAAEMEEWGIESFLLMSSGSSILAGAPPRGEKGWKVRLEVGEGEADGEVEGAPEMLLARGGIGTSGSSMRGDHIIDPSIGIPSSRHLRSWAMSDSAAEADALSTAWMNMSWDQITACCGRRASVGAVVLDREGQMRFTGGTCLIPGDALDLKGSVSAG